MNQGVLIFLASPEIMSFFCLLIPPARRWLLKMIEDSDGDPHHTDGFFIATLWCATLCIRGAILFALYDIMHEHSNIGYVVAFLTYGTALLGVRFASTKINLNNLIKTKHDKDHQLDS